MRKSIFITILLSLMILSACGSNATPPAADMDATIIPETLTEVPHGDSSPEPVGYEPITLRINRSKLTSFAPVFIAEAEGYFAKYGITLDHLDMRSTQALPLLVSGDLDAFAGSLDTGVINVIYQDPSIKVVADRGHISVDDPCTYMGIVVRKDLYDSGEITGPADLAGQIIIANSVGSDGYFLYSYLAKAGLTFDDIVLSDLPTTGYIDAFVNKSVAALVAPELHISRLISAGNVVLLAGAEDYISPAQLALLLFGKSLLVDNREIGARFMAAYLQGVQQYNEGKTERNLQIMADSTGETIELLQASCWIPINIDGEISFPGIIDFQQWAIAQGLQDKYVSEEQLWDPNFLTAAQILLHP